MSNLPAEFPELEKYVADWAKPTRAERYEMRLSKTYDELCEFYDTAGARAEDAIVYLNGQDINNLDQESLNLLRIMYSLILTSYAVNIFNQPKIPDSGAAWVDTTFEPAI
jgi:hypothetical protein